jgi:hypothetical protein
MEELSNKIKEVIKEKIGKDGLEKMLTVADDGNATVYDEFVMMVEKELTDWLYAYSEYLTELPADLYMPVFSYLTREIVDYIFKEWYHGRL